MQKVNGWINPERLGLIMNKENMLKVANVLENVLLFPFFFLLLECDLDYKRKSDSSRGNCDAIQLTAKCHVNERTAQIGFYCNSSVLRLYWELGAVAT